MRDWKSVKGYEMEYNIASDGTVASIRRRKFLSANINSGGYFQVSLHKNGVSESWAIHRLLALHYVPGYFEGAEVNHKDGNKLNNALDNLEWVTSADNTRHAFRLGLIPQQQKRA